MTVLNKTNFRTKGESLSKILFFLLPILLLQCKDKHIDEDSLQNFDTQQKLLGLTIFDFQKNWNKCIKDWDIEGLEYLYINEFDLDYTFEKYAATTTVTDNSGFAILIAASLDKQTNQIENIFLRSEIPNDDFRKAIQLASCGNLLSSIFKTINQKSGVKFVGNMLQELIDNKKNFSIKRINSIPLIVTYEDETLLISIGLEP